MSNKIKEQLRLSQLSDEKTQLDVDNAYSVVKESVLSFSTFLARNYEVSSKSTFRRLGTRNYEKLEDVFKIWENGV